MADQAAEARLPSWEEYRSDNDTLQRARERRAMPHLIPVYDRIAQYEADIPIPEPVKLQVADIMRRLYWGLQGSIAASIFILPETYSATETDNMEPYVRETDSGTTLHPISQQLLAVPAISSVRVTIANLYSLLPDWREVHEGCSLDGRELELIDDDDWAEYADTEDDDGNPAWIIRCGCGSLKPDFDCDITVKASSNRGLTVDDYIQVIHPWLLSHKANILEAMDMCNICCPKRPITTKLVVESGYPNLLLIEEEAAWKRSRSIFHSRVPTWI